MKEKPNGEQAYQTGADSSGHDAARKREIELVGMRVAMAYEKVDAVEDAKLEYLNILERDIENAEALKDLRRLGVSEEIIEEVQSSGRGK